MHKRFLNDFFIENFFIIGFVSDALHIKFFPSSDKSVSTLDGIPTEAIEMECPNSEFKCSMLQEFIILDTKYKACIDNVNKCHSHATW